MPSVSKAQFRKMRVLYKQGKITRQQLENFTSVDYKQLPERVKAKTKKARKGRRTKARGR